MILVCAAGLRGSNADDVAKEIAIYRAHKAAPIAIVDDGESRFSAAVDTISVPAVHPDLAFVLCTMAGHLFGYEAALAIDASARPLREARGCIETAFAAVRSGEDPLGALAIALEPHAARFFDELRTRNYDGSLEAATAVRVASVLRYATGPATARHLPDRVRQGRHAEHGGRGPQRRAHEGHRGADAPDRRDQAPGQDGHGGHLALRRDAAPRAAREGSARGRCAPRQPHLPRVAHARRARRVGRQRVGLDPLQHRG